MSTQDTDTPAWLAKLSETYRSIRLARGVVGKTSHAMIGIIGVWAIIAWQLSDNLVRDVALLSAGAIITGVFVWWTRSTQSFAERNPSQAMLDGAEFLEWHKFDAQAKGQLRTIDTPLLSDPSQPMPVVEIPIKRPDND
jgi:hypothetical protein